MSEEFATVQVQEGQNEYPKVDIGTRLISAIIDGVIQWIVSLIPFIGGIIGAAYMLLKDGLFFFKSSC
jgi:hypothetical protein